MELDYVPLLRIQRELHGLPRNLQRFLQYLRTMENRYGIDGMRVPLLIMNPMGREHVTALLDQLLALDGDGVAARALAEVSPQVADVPGSAKVTLVIADDLKGGWTNRYAWEFDLRFRYAGPPPERLPHWLKHFWVSAVVWSSEPATEQRTREAVLTAVLRMAYVYRHGTARTLRDKLAQEGHVMAMAGCTAPVLDADDLAYTREVLVPYLDADDMRTTIECLFGDAAARTLGFTSRGLSPWAGLAVALADSLSGPVHPQPPPSVGSPPA
jgi:hypothetical protein